MTRAGKAPRRGANLQALHKRLEAYMKRKGLRSTAQRRQIAETFFTGPNHVTIEELLTRVREDEPRVGYATVYRTLKLFAECGIAAERHFGDGQTRYELSDESVNAHHDHLICLECGRIIEFHDERIEALQEQVAQRLGFRIGWHKHEIYGTCEREECLAAGRRGAERAVELEAR
jgi:Fur family ferric uptake transcriptional regulator